MAVPKEKAVEAAGTSSGHHCSVTPFVRAQAASAQLPFVGLKIYQQQPKVFRSPALVG